MEERIIIAGFGGQGVMAIGQLLTFSGMEEGKHVSWLPSYGPEMRGGTANCSVIVSDKPVGAPIVTTSTSAIVMNLPAFNKFEPLVRPGGNLFVNSSLVDIKSERDDINIYYIPANEIADQVGNNRTANMVMLGAFIEVTGAVKEETITDKAFVNVFGERRLNLLPVNKEALDKGREAAKNQK